MLAMMEYSKATSVMVSIGRTVHGIIPYRSDRIKYRKSLILIKYKIYRPAVENNEVYGLRCKITLIKGETTITYQE